jgi:ATP-dependent DNA ligase
MIIDDLYDIADAPTKTDKAMLIDNCVTNGCGRILKMIFDPMVTFLVSVVRLPELRLYDSTLETPSNEELESLLEKLANRTLTGNAAINACCNFGNRLNDYQFSMFCDILQSNPRIGIGLTDLNKRSEHFFVPQFKVHLCLALKKAKGKISFNKAWFLQPKIDGNRIIGIKHNLTKLLSRGGHENTALQHIVDILNKYQGNVVFDGEVEYKDSLEATGAIRRKNGKQCKEAIYTLFGIYDILQWESEKHTDTYETCYSRVKGFVESLSSKDQLSVRLVESINIGSFTNEQDWLNTVDNYYEHFLSQGYEGIVAKTLDHVYLPSSGSKRSPFTLKHKPWLDKEVTVVGLKESKTQDDVLGSFNCIDDEDREFDCATGNITDAELEYIWTHQHKFIDQRLEIKHQGMTKDNVSYRHPNAVKFRLSGD